jgi:hypothetical protein
LQYEFICADDLELFHYSHQLLPLAYLFSEKIRYSQDDTLFVLNNETLKTTQLFFVAKVLFSFFPRSEKSEALDSDRVRCRSYGMEFRGSFGGGNAQRR